MNTIRLARIQVKLRAPNQSMKPTQHFVVSFRSMNTPILKVLGGLSLRLMIFPAHSPSRDCPSMSRLPCSLHSR
jgi:hypothetical protein